MKKYSKIFAIIVVVLILVVGVALSYVSFALPDVGPAPELKVEITPARLARGKYLANHVNVCIDCHSTRDMTLFAGPMDTTRLGVGGEIFDQKMGFPGSFYARNITPAGIGDWTDGEFLRAITMGVNKDGKALFPLMPYQHVALMDKEDVYSIMAYIRSLPAIETNVPESKPDFPMNFILNTVPKKVELNQKMPSPNDQIAYGKYLVNAASCNDCHTKQEQGAPVAGMEFAGGFEFNLPTGAVYSANITPDKESGIGSWQKEQFVSRFKAFADSSYKPAKVGPKDFQTVMPWTMYAGMTSSDLEAIYAYLKTLKPINNKVTKFVAN